MFEAIMIACGIIVLAFLVALVLMYNLLLVKRNTVKNAFSVMDVVIKKRFDLMPNLVSAVKMYMSHEIALFERITELRAKVDNDNATDAEKLEADNEVTNIIRKINLTAENYPDLKSDASLAQAQVALQECEDELMAARRLYDDDVTTYNNYLGVIPANIFALILGFKKYELFVAKEEERDSQNWFGA